MRSKWGIIVPCCNFHNQSVSVGQSTRPDSDVCSMDFTIRRWNHMFVPEYNVLRNLQPCGSTCRILPTSNIGGNKGDTESPRQTNPQGVRDTTHTFFARNESSSLLTSPQIFNQETRPWHGVYWVLQRSAHPRSSSAYL